MNFARRTWNGLAVGLAFWAVMMPATAHAETALPVRKSEAVSQIAKAAPEPTLPGRTQDAQPTTPAPPPLSPDASGDVGKDPATTYVPGIRRTKPTVPPKPEALQRWLSRI